MAASFFWTPFIVTDCEMQHAILLGILDLFIKYLKKKLHLSNNFSVLYERARKVCKKNLILPKVCIIDPYTKLITLKKLFLRCFVKNGS